MKFTRFGAIKLQKQVHYKEAEKDIYPCSPPCKKGFFCFPAGFMDPFYLPISRPPEHPNSMLQYLKDDNGKKLLVKDLYTAVVKEGEYGPYEDRFLTEEGKAFLKRRGLKERDIFKVNRPSYVMIYPNTDEELTFYGIDTENEDRSRLSQPLTYLLDPDGEKVTANSFYYYNDFWDDYEYGYTGVDPEKTSLDEEFHLKDGRKIKILSWLKMNNIRPEQLCAWPVYPPLENQYLATLKKYHVFEYEGCLWHHLGSYLKRSEILSQFSDTWFYTDIHAYERALKKSMGKGYGKKKKYQREMDPSNAGIRGAYEFNYTFNPIKMYEVFIDEKIH